MSTTISAQPGATLIPGDPAVIRKWYHLGPPRFIGGNLAAPLAFPLTLTSSNTVIGPFSLALTITLGNGLFGGTFQLPGTNVLVKFQGAILQSRTNGSGYFRNAGQSGWVQLGLAP